MSEDKNSYRNSGDWFEDTALWDSPRTSRPSRRAYLFADFFASYLTDIVQRADESVRRQLPEHSEIKIGGQVMPKYDP